MTTKLLNDEEGLNSFYRYNADKQSWEYLDPEYGWTMVSSKIDAIHDARLAVITFGTLYLNQLETSATKRVPDYVPPPQLEPTALEPVVSHFSMWSCLHSMVFFAVGVVVGLIISGVFPPLI